MPKPRPISETMRVVLAKIQAGLDGYDGVSGRSESGGRGQTLTALIRRDLIDWDPVLKRFQTTQAGRALLAAAIQQAAIDRERSKKLKRSTRPDR